ncbi:MAG: hypothetical protein CVU65_17305 [Deltaproteobacteria bacterium HGW-Deltaproteobacteria-22]|nr:MAG: hypothetical protein CVU65_17305 [Deltaproteobacteria bacterium HGW-Deltaproteobacteria-22]
MFRSLMFLMISMTMVLSSCGGKKDKEAKDDEPGKDWSAKPLAATEGAIGAIKFTVDLPAGFKVDNQGDVNISWRPDMDDYFSEPSVQVLLASTPAKTPEEFVSNAMLDKNDEVIKSEKTADGFLLEYATKNKGILRVSVQKAAGEKALVCNASQAKQGGVPNFEATRAWLGKICGSLKLK